MRSDAFMIVKHLKEYTAGTCQLLVNREAEVPKLLQELQSVLRIVAYAYTEYRWHM